MIVQGRARGLSVPETRTRRRRALAQRARSMLYHATLISICAIVLLPLVWMLSSSLKSDNEIFIYPPHLIPAHPKWQNYAAAMQYIDFWRYFGNTMIVAGFSVAGTIFSCTLTAYSFARLQWKGRNVVFALCMATLMLPFQVTMIPLYIIFRHLGWIGTYLPLIVPAYFGNALYSFLDSWQDFLGPLIYLDNQAMFTLSLGLQGYFSLHQTAWAYLLCASVIFTLPAILIFLFAQKTFIQGITLTGVKG